MNVFLFCFSHAKTHYIHPFGSSYLMVISISILKHVFQNLFIVLYYDSLIRIFHRQFQYFLQILFVKCLIPNKQHLPQILEGLLVIPPFNSKPCLYKSENDPEVSNEFIGNDDKYKVSLLKALPSPFVMNAFNNPGFRVYNLVQLGVPDFYRKPFVLIAPVPYQVIGFIAVYAESLR